MCRALAPARPGMDCADETALVRRALAAPPASRLGFDLVGRLRRRHLRRLPHYRRGDRRRRGADRAGRARPTRRRARATRPSLPTSASPSRRERRGVDGGQRRAAAGGVGVGGVDRPHLDRAAHRASPRDHDGGVVVSTLASIVAGLWPFLPRAVGVAAPPAGSTCTCWSACRRSAPPGSGRVGEGAAVAFLFAVAHRWRRGASAGARGGVATLVGHEPGWGEEGRHQAAPVGALDRALRRGLHAGRDRSRRSPWRRPAARRRPVGDVVLSRADLSGARLPLRARHLHAGDGGRGADLRGAARSAVPGRAGAGAGRRRRRRGAGRRRPGADRAGGRRRGRSRRGTPGARST